MGINSAATKAANDANIRRWEFANQYKIDKACPFCNKTMAIVEQDKENEELYLVKCRECYAITPRAPTPEAAIQLWNDETFPDYIWLTNKDVPYLNDPEIWGELKNAVVVASFVNYKKEMKLAMKSWRNGAAYDQHIDEANKEKAFFLSRDFEYFSDISGDKIIETADKQAVYDVRFREPNRCRGCGNNACQHQKYIWWLWEPNNMYDACAGWKKRKPKRKSKNWPGGRLYRLGPR